MSARTFDQFDSDLCLSYEKMNWRKPIGLKSKSRPTVVCLCGSSRFMPLYEEWEYRLTMLGYIVLTIGAFPNVPERRPDLGCTPQQKESLDLLHKHKIRMADVTFVINYGGYVGESTDSEIDYAQSIGKEVFYLENRITNIVPDQPDAIAIAAKEKYGDGTTPGTAAPAPF